MRSIRLYFARARLRKVHAEIDVAMATIAAGQQALDTLLVAERQARGEVFVLEHPQLVRRPSAVRR